MKKILASILLVLMFTIMSAQFASAYSQPLEKELANAALAKKAVEMASKYPKTGSGTPYFAADGVLGASAIAASVFGGIAMMFFIIGRRGRYVAQGRG
jgi:hypothetical protein